MRELLENVKWADEIVICDSFSTDKTVDICREYTDRIYQYKHKNSADQKNWTIPRCRHEWIFHVDTDERASDELIGEIRALMKNPVIKYEAFNIPSEHYMFGRWVRGVNHYREMHKRLFRRHLRYEDKYIHARLVSGGKVGTLNGTIVHKGWEDMDAIKYRFRRHRRLCLLEKKKERDKYKFYHLILRPPALFLYIFIVKRGFIDGWRGLFYTGFISLLEFCVLKDLFFGKIIE
jgi:glycosyltransferase involved in cell wall biosynthesis